MNGVSETVSGVQAAALAGTSGAGDSVLWALGALVLGLALVAILVVWLIVWMRAATAEL